MKPTPAVSCTSVEQERVRFWHHAAMPTVPLQRLIASFPDAVTAAAFLVLWIAPTALGESAVRNALLVMLVEFVIIHASGMLGAIVLGAAASRGKKLAALLGFGAFYMLFIGAFMLIFGEYWPALVFGWLLLAKFGGVLSRGGRGVGEHERQMAVWLVSFLAYLFGAFATILLPLPRLGLQVDVVATLGLPGSGLWVEQPHRLLAFGFFYFAVLALYKWLEAGLAARPRVPSRSRS